MIITGSVKHPDGVIVEGQTDTASEFAEFEEYAKNFFNGNPDILEGSIIYVANEGCSYVKNSYGEWKKEEITSGGGGTVDAYTKSETNTLLDKKVDKVSGKQLSTEDYTTVDKEKLESISIDEYVKKYRKLSNGKTTLSDVIESGFYGLPNSLTAVEDAPVFANHPFNYGKMIVVRALDTVTQIIFPSTNGGYFAIRGGSKLDSSPPVYTDWILYDIKECVKFTNLEEYGIESSTTIPKMQERINSIETAIDEDVHNQINDIVLKSTSITKEINNSANSVVLDEFSVDEYAVLSVCMTDAVAIPYCGGDGKWHVQFTPVSGALAEREIAVTVFYIETPSDLTGTPPLTFDSNGLDLIDYRIYGAEGGVGIRTKNLFDKENTVLYRAYISAATNTWKKSSDSASVQIPCFPNTTYTLSAKRSLYNIFRIAEAEGMSEPVSSENRDENIIGLICNDGKLDNFTFTTSENAHALIFQSDKSVEDEWLNSLQLEYGEQVTDYEPYGFKIPVTISGLNEKVTTKDIFVGLLPLQAGESISLSETGVQIPTFSGKNTLTVDTEIQPDKVYIRYKK